MIQRFSVGPTESRFELISGEPGGFGQLNTQCGGSAVYCAFEGLLRVRSRNSAGLRLLKHEKVADRDGRSSQLVDISYWQSHFQSKGLIVVGSPRVEILVVEHGTPDSQWIQSELEHTGLISVVQVVADVPAALSALRGEAPFEVAIRPSLILVNLPGVDSDEPAASGQPNVINDLELLSELKSDPELRSIPVVIATNSNDEADILNSYSFGACSFVSKPTEPEERRRLFARFASYWAQVAQLPGAFGNIDEAPLVRLVDAELNDEELAARGPIEPIEVLVVDDSDDDVLLLREAFSGCELVRFVDTVDDGEAALQYLRQQAPYAEASRPALVLLDINMPRKNGFDVLAEMQRDERLARVPVIMLTTSKQESDILRAYAGGACSFISKPVNFDRMCHIAEQFAAYWTLVADVPRRIETPLPHFNGSTEPARV